MLKHNQAQIIETLKSLNFADRKCITKSTPPADFKWEGFVHAREPPGLIAEPLLLDRPRIMPEFTLEI
jgi:hypothetical protein